MIWTLGAFTAWLRDRDRSMLEFHAVDMLLIGGIVIGCLLILNLWM